MWFVLLALSLFTLFTSVASAQTSIYTPNGNYLCNEMSMLTTCMGPRSEDDVIIRKFGPNAYSVTPMMPAPPPTYEVPETSGRGVLGALGLGRQRAYEDGYEDRAPRHPRPCAIARRC